MKRAMFTYSLNGVRDQYEPVSLRSLGVVVNLGNVPTVIKAYDHPRCACVHVLAVIIDHYSVIGRQPRQRVDELLDGHSSSSSNGSKSHSSPHPVQMLSDSSPSSVT